MCLLLGATLGVGNIVGIAVGINVAGPGIVVWITIFGLLSLTIKYLESYYAKKYETKKLLGPYAYFDKLKFKHIYKYLYGILILIVGLFGIGSLTQSSSIINAVTTIFKTNYLVKILLSFILLIICGYILIFRKNQVLKICLYLVPFMGILYVGLCISCLLVKINELQTAFKLMFLDSVDNLFLKFSITSFLLLINEALQKCILSTEIGLGTCALATAASNKSTPIKKATKSLAAMLLTIFICFITGIVITLGLKQNKTFGIESTFNAFRYCIDSKIVEYLLIVIIICFGISTIIGFNIYTTITINQLFKNKKILKIYNTFYLISVMLGGIISLSIVWKLADFTCLILAVLNITSIIIITKGEQNENWKL